LKLILENELVVAHVVEGHVFHFADFDQRNPHGSRWSGARHGYLFDAHNAAPAAFARSQASPYLRRNIRNVPVTGRLRRDS
jgi:hypothetical protein